MDEQVEKVDPLNNPLVDAIKSAKGKEIMNDLVRQSDKQNPVLEDNMVSIEDVVMDRSCFIGVNNFPMQQVSSVNPLRFH